MTLEGTNTWLAAGWVVDPGPADPAHLDAILAAGPVLGIALTHSHADHAEGAEELASRAGGVPILHPRGDRMAGPFEAVATPGHSPDHVCLVFGEVGFSGDLVLGAGSVFIAPGEGSLSAYMHSLTRLMRLGLDALCPGHGPVIWDPRAKIEDYVAHRLDRERRLLEALGSGLRAPDELLDHAWSDAPENLRPAAMLTMQAHLQKLAEEGRLPDGMVVDALGVPEQQGTLGADAGP